MKLLDTIQKNLVLYQEMKQAEMPCDLLEICKGREEKLLLLCREINQKNAGEIIANLQTGAVSYLIEDPEFLSCLIRFVQEENVAITSLEYLLEHAENDRLSKGYHYEELQQVLTDEEVYSEWKYEYLRFYSGYALDSEQKGRLMDGIWIMDRFSDLPLAKLAAQEQLLLIEPFFASGFIANVISYRQIWKYFEQPQVIELLNMLAGYIGNCSRLNRNQMEEIGKNAEQMLGDMKIVMLYVPEEIKASFLVKWLENESLLYDLRQLKRRMPCVEEETIVKSVKNRISYLNFLYGDYLSGMDLGSMDDKKQKILIYAITHRKKHFLSLVKENISSFLRLSRYSFLMDEDLYRKYFNLNTLNGKNLEEAYELRRLTDEVKDCLEKKEYTFAELKLFAVVEKPYVWLYHRLSDLKYDERMKTIRELVGKDCIRGGISEENLAGIAEKLSQKPLSKWMQEELGHIENLSWKCAVRLLTAWEELERFIPDVKTEQHILFLLKNRTVLKNYPDFASVTKQITEIDATWEKLCQQLAIKPSFIETHRKGVQEFLYQGGAEIFGQFLGNAEEELEKVRRLCLAELAGKFYDVKYHEGDLEREIALELPIGIKNAWQKNFVMKNGDVKLWEEDRLLPVMQLGELVGSTCLSYKNGRYKECLLSAFDANKKVLYLSLNGELVFRAMLRLTKGTLEKKRNNSGQLQFIDITKETDKEGKKDLKKTEHLTLFLERPYFKGVSEEKQKKIVHMVIRMLKQKLKTLPAHLVLSESYKTLIPEDAGFVRAQYYMYISASKNGKQYLDSLGGMATVNNEGSYKREFFLLPLTLLRSGAENQGGRTYA